MKNITLTCLVLIATLLGVRLAMTESTLTVATIPGFPGGTTVLPVAAQDITNVVATQFDVQFNPAKVQAGPALLGQTPPNHVIRSREISPGVFRVVIYSLNNTSLVSSNESVLAEIPFTVNSNERVGTGPIGPVNALLAKTDSSVISPLTVVPGQIFVRALNPNPDGSVSFFLPSQAGATYVIQATTNFVDWVNISTNMALSEFLDVLDADAVNFDKRFYRSLLLE